MSHYNSVKVEFGPTITNPIIPNHSCNSLANLRVISPTRMYSLCIVHYDQYYILFTSCYQFFFSSLHPAHSAFSWQGIFFIYFRVILHEFVSGSFRKSCAFFPWFLTGIPLSLFLKTTMSLPPLTLQ